MSSWGASQCRTALSLGCNAVALRAVVLFVAMVLSTSSEHHTEPGTRSVALCAATASLITKAVLHPIDTIKCRVQARTSAPGITNFLSEWRGHWTPRYLYRGLTLKLAMYAPFQSTYITAYSVSKRKLEEAGLQKLVVVLLASLVADFTAAIIRVPMEAAKMRLQASVYPNTTEALRALRSDGVRRVSRLFVPQIIVHDVPYGFVQWLCYEYLKPAIGPCVHEALAGLGHGHDTSIENAGFTSLISGGISGCIAGLVTAPLDLVKTRTVVRSAHSESVHVRTVVREVARDHGLRGFWRGASARVLWISTNVAVYFALFEAMKAAVTERDSRLSLSG